MNDFFTTAAKAGLHRKFTRIGGSQFIMNRIHPKYPHEGLMSLNTKAKEVEKVFGDSIYYMPEIKDYKVNGYICDLAFELAYDAWRINIEQDFKPQPEKTLREIRNHFYMYWVVDDIYKIGIADERNIGGRIAGCRHGFIYSILDIPTPDEKDIFLEMLKRHPFCPSRKILIYLYKRDIINKHNILELENELIFVGVMKDAISFEAKIKRGLNKPCKKYLINALNTTEEEFNKLDGKTELFILNKTDINNIQYSAIFDNDAEEVTKKVINNIKGI